MYLWVFFVVIVPLEYISLIWRRHHHHHVTITGLGLQILTNTQQVRVLKRATPTVKRVIRFNGHHREHMTLSPVAER